MGHTYTCSLHHVVFSTKERRPWIAEPLRDSLNAFMGGIARKNGFKFLGAGGVADHTHLLISTPAHLDLSKAVQLIEAGSSKYFRQTHQPRFEWQEGFSAFSVSKSAQAAMLDYIHNQPEHHRKRSFDDELKVLLEKHGIKMDV